MALDANTTPQLHTVYRHEFSNPTLKSVILFAAIHRYDTPAGFKESWEVWAEANEDLILNETQMLRR